MVYVQIVGNVEPSEFEPNFPDANSVPWGQNRNKELWNVSMPFEALQGPYFARSAHAIGVRELFLEYARLISLAHLVASTPSDQLVLPGGE